jgi:Mlc titration factor MtfA (ptsG expression regulator)
MLFSFFRGRRRQQLAAQPFPSEWESIVTERLKFAAKLDAAELERFKVHLKVFALDKDWVGAHGLTVTDEMKVVIAGAAARLARNLDLDIYDELRTIVVHPSHFKVGESDDVVFGEAHRWGQVVLSWDAVTHGIANAGDGRDTALHEFAHVLDASDGGFDGTPELHQRSDYEAWAKVFSHHYFALKERPHKNVLRPYGATNEAEFFAVATEAFFEKPLQLKGKSPELYEELKRYYLVDPAAALARK